MAQAAAPPASGKRGSLRTTRAAQPPLKKVKAIETPLQSSSSVQSPSVQSPAPSRAEPKLPTKVADCRPLPSLPSPQPLSLPSSTYQSLAESAVLYASLDRSRLRWVQHGVFDRYWTKPESGKNARPPPPNNPEAKWMKHRGPCRIRVEPHIFECELYVEERPRPPVQKIRPQPAYAQGGNGGYGQQYRPSPGPAYGQQRPYSPAQQTPIRQSPAPLPPPRPQQSGPQQQQPEKKTGPDPVISMLAGRASSDPELKALMKEVATGAANPEQLKVFQSHIDELTKIITEKKKKEEEEAAAAEAKKAAEQQQESIQYDGAIDQRPQQIPQPYQPPPPQQQAWTHQPPPSIQATSPPPPPSAPSVIIQFTTPGSTEDRFLFPPNSIVESLSPQHLLCSTLIVRKGSESAGDPALFKLDPKTEYFQPVTFMVEVAYGRESLIELVKKHVKPADEVRKHMEDVMQQCTRAPGAFLATRLPIRGTEGAETEEEEKAAQEEARKKLGIVEDGFGPGGTGTGRGPGGANIKYVKKPGPKKGEGGRPVGVKNGEGGGKRASLAGGSKEATPTMRPAGVQAAAPASIIATAKGAEMGQATDADKATEIATVAGASAETPKPADGTGGSESIDAKDSGPEAAQADGADGAARPKRTVRKSVRILDV